MKQNTEKNRKYYTNFIKKLKFAEFEVANSETRPKVPMVAIKLAFQGPVPL